MRSSHTVSILLIALGLLVGSAQADAQEHHSSPDGDFQKVSDLVDLPEFLPGLGILHVDPATLPAGPFLAYDREGELVSTMYMIPLEDLNEREAFEGLDVADRPVEHVDIVFNAGHPGVPQPHYHVILWHVSREHARALD